MKSKSIYLTILIALIALNFCLAQDNDLTFGKTLKLNSKILKEDRNIFVYTPARYENSQDKFPVLYVLDGERNFFFSCGVVNFLSNNGRMPQMIVVGIPNTDRVRDFTPTATADRPNSGSADNFLKFMENELIPYIDKNYRTQPSRLLTGHSLCGMFAIYALFTRPELFHAYIAVSPYLQYDEEIVNKKIAMLLKENTNFKKSLYFTIGNEPDYTNALNNLMNMLNNQVKELTWKFTTYDKDDHGSVPLKSLYDGLEFIYADWRLPDGIAEQGYPSIEKHYQKLTQKYGYQIDVPEALLNRLGYQLLGQNKNAEALDIFKKNVQKYPESANVYDSLGEGLEQDNQLEQALKQYAIAVEKGEKLNDPNLQIYKDHIVRAQKKLHK